MASITQQRGGYRAFVCVKGIRDSSPVFRTRREANNWALLREEEILQEQERFTKGKSARSLRNLIKRYMAEALPARPKSSQIRERVSLNLILNRELVPLDKNVADLVHEDFDNLVLTRSKEVSNGTVRRDMSALATVLNYGTSMGMRWLKSNPMRGIGWPKAAPHRDNIFRWWEIRAIVRRMGYRTGVVRTKADELAVMLLFACRTGMRIGEILALKWTDINDEFCIVAGIDEGAKKTSAAVRTVPLTPQAIRLLGYMRNRTLGFKLRLRDGYIFGAGSSNSHSQRFRRFANLAGIEHLTFHDSRHTAATLMARKMPLLDLCRTFGWSDTKMALTYYNANASDIVNLLKTPLQRARDRSVGSAPGRIY